MSFEDEFQSKKMAAEEAAALVKSGDWIDYGWGTGTPFAFDIALARRAGELEDVNLRGFMLSRELEIFKSEEGRRAFTWNSFYSSSIERNYIAHGCAYHIPMRYSEISRYCRENLPRASLAVIVAAPMDKFGYFNFGFNCVHQETVLERAKKVVIEVNKSVPRCRGGIGNVIHISDVDGIIDGGGVPIPEVPPAAATDADRKIAEWILPEIPDGACLQVGIGRMPGALGEQILRSDLKDLGIHTEMYTDAFVDLTLAGKITGARKNIDRGRQTFALAIGSKKTYDFIDDNPQMMVTSVDYVNDIHVLSALDNFISVNNIVEADLFGQINAESSGTTHIGGAGGQFDFVLGAYLSRGGKSFLCCPSTFRAKDGHIRSRVRPTLDGGSIVTDTRANVQWVVTEYGKVNLKGMTTWQRAEALISVAHPDFRDELIKEAEKLKIWRRSSKI